MSWEDKQMILFSKVTSAEGGTHGYKNINAGILKGDPEELLSVSTEIELFWLSSCSCSWRSGLIDCKHQEVCLICSLLKHEKVHCNELIYSYILHSFPMNRERRLKHYLGSLTIWVQSSEPYLGKRETTGTSCPSLFKHTFTKKERSKVNKFF